MLKSGTIIETRKTLRGDPRLPRRAIRGAPHGVPGRGHEKKKKMTREWPEQARGPFGFYYKCILYSPPPPERHVDGIFESAVPSTLTFWHSQGVLLYRRYICPPESMTCIRSTWNEFVQVFLEVLIPAFLLYYLNNLLSRSSCFPRSGPNTAYLVLS